MDIATIVMSAYFAVIIFAGFYVLWREWRMRAEEEKRRIREKIDEYMKERER
jgi:ABC-type nickel/cobalt efflux system permease component RcnA